MGKDYRLLEDSTILLLQPELAMIIGYKEALILQQIHYWVENAKADQRNFYDGRYWVYNTYKKWQEQFPFIKVDTVKKTILKLEKLNLLITGNYNKYGYDKTKWYSVDYERLKSIVNAHRIKNISLNGEDIHYGRDIESPTNTINYNKTSPKNSYYSTHSDEMSEFDFGILYKQLDICYMNLTDTYESMNYSVAEYKDVFTYFYRCYQNIFGNHHPMLNNYNIKSVMVKLPYVELEDYDEIVVDAESNIYMIDYYFDQDFGSNCNYSILHYVSGDIRKYAYYKTLH